MAKGIMQPKTLSDELADFMGKKKASRAQIVKKFWEYVKKNDLQDPDDRRVVIVDDELAEAFDLSEGDEVHMTQVGGLISTQIID